MYTNLKPQGYRPRLVDALVAQYLDTFGAVELCGTRWCGKSWTAAAFSRSITRVDEDKALYNDDPSLALIGDQPHTIDEWQDAEAIWNRVRHRVDDSDNAPGQFILTGSSTPPKSEERHSGAGRIGRLRMRTMTLSELGLSSGSVSLGGLFEGNFAPQESHLGLEEYASIICKGGWPALLNANELRSSVVIAEYLDALFNVSMRSLGKDPQTSRRLAIALARNLGTSATLKTLAADASAGVGSLLSDDTVASYLTDFSLNYFVDELPGWDAPIKSRSRVRTKPKRYLDDPSMAAALLGVNSERLLGEGQLFGALFESLCIHDLAVYASLLPGITSTPLRYYADADGLEVDVIIELQDGRWAAIEIKRGDVKVEDAAKSLKRLRDKVMANPAAQNREPEFMAVLVGRASFARQRQEDGIYVVPLDTLGA